VKNVAAKGRIKLPKIGWIALVLTKPIKGEIKNATVSREGKQYFVSIQVETGEVAPAAGLVPKLGIDMGLKAFIASSDGELVQPLKAMERQAKRLRRYQKSVSRKKKCSCNRRKAIERVGWLHRRISHQRSDWVHKLTTKLADRHAVIAIEDLKIASMSASARGTAEVPGKNVSAKSGLNRRILDAAWGMFKEQLQYKLAARGGELIKVNPAYTSQMCSSCKFVHKGNIPDQETFLCLACGHAENADLNAAKNILAAGLVAVLERNQSLSSEACGEVVRRARPARAKRAASAKQEPTEERKCQRSLSTQ
jgi:putative transposase